jgi:RNA-directed DNA polymerase
LDALAVGIQRKKVNWVLDADIRGFYDAIDHGWMLKFLEHRIADQRVLRLIRKWLKAEVIENGVRSDTEEGTAQGASASPLLSNVYLHYVFDLWADQWRRRHARGDVIIVRFADDYIVGFEHQDDAQRFLAELRSRLAKFSLELAAEKTRLIQFGRYASERRQNRGLGKPETFGFLGFTHICAKTNDGHFMLKRITEAKRMRAKLHALQGELMRCRHQPIPEQGRWLASPDHAPFAQPAIQRQNPSQEPSALAVHAGICAGAARASKRRAVPTATPYAWRGAGLRPGGRPARTGAGMNAAPSIAYGRLRPAARSVCIWVCSAL